MNFDKIFNNLIKEELTLENFKKYYDLAYKIILNSSLSRKNNYRFNKYTIKYEKEIAYLIMFIQRYLNMINHNKVIMYIGDNCNTLDPDNPASYNNKDGIINYRLSAIINNYSYNIPLMIEICIHENRHYMQYQPFYIESMDELLKYDDNSLLLFKETLYFSNHDPSFYISNVFNIFLENDADLYANSITNSLINTLFPVTEEELTIYNKKSHINTFNNPFIDIKTGYIKGKYKMEDDTKIDRIIVLDKYLKKVIDKDFVHKYPILNFIYKDGKFKTYDELMEDKNKYLNLYKNKGKVVYQGSPNYRKVIVDYTERIEGIYDYFIKTDPMLLIEDMIAKNKIENIKVLLKENPDIIKYYKNELNNLIGKYLQ